MGWKEGKRCGTSGKEWKCGERERGLKIIFKKVVSMIASFHKTRGNKNHIAHHTLKLNLDIILVQGRCW